MAEPTTFASNNPFRRKAAAGLSSSSAPPLPLPSSADPGSSALPSDKLAQDQPTGEQFRTQFQSLPHPSLPPPQTSFQKPKVVKKVRVQSPPPSSPESAGAPEPYSEWPSRPPESAHVPGANIEVEAADPFGNPTAGGPDGGDDEEESDSGSKAVPWRSVHGSQPGEGADISSRSRKAPALDVNAFSRLLLTGHREKSLAGSGASPSPSTIQQSGATTGDSGSITDASSVSRHSVFDTTHGLGETPRTSHEISDTGEEDQHELMGSRQPKRGTGTLKKKPPPPSSRHGKLIRVKLQGRNSPASLGSDRPSPMPRSYTPPPSTPSDINKPLPPAPGRPSMDDGLESIFDREAAGKVPELDLDPDADSVPPPRPPTPPNASHATSATATAAPTSQVTKKPTPPPRRNHGRTDSKSVNPGPTAPAVGVSSPTEEVEQSAPGRSSLDSTRSRSRSSSFRTNVNAPAPPPPRRPNHGRTPSSLTSPMAPSFTSVTSSGGEKSPAEVERFPSYTSLAGGLVDPLGLSATPPSTEASPGLGISNSRNNSSSSLAQAAYHSLPKLSPPPPPPTRSVSVRSRRPPSVSSIEATSKRIPKDREGVTSAPHAPPPPPPRQRGSSRGSVEAPATGPRRTSIESVRMLADPVVEEAESSEPSAANDILADLDALQREVDAFRAQQRRLGSRSASGASAG